MKNALGTYLFHFGADFHYVAGGLCRIEGLSEINASAVGAAIGALGLDLVPDIRHIDFAGLAQQLKCLVDLQPRML